MVWLQCPKGHKWNYKGKKKDYAACSTCRSKISIPKARKRYLASEKRRKKREEKKNSGGTNKKQLGGDRKK